MATWERAMVAWPNGERCQRSRETFDTARRVHRWHSAPERCTNCGKQAVVVCGSEAFCAACRTQRDDRVRTAQRFAPDTAAGEAVSVGTAEGDRVLRGHAIVFGERSVDLGGFVEIIRPSAVDRTIAEKSDLRALWNHGSESVLGRVKSGTLKVAKVATGLLVTISAPAWAQGHVESVQRRDVTGMSFAFRALDDEWRMDHGVPVREVTDMRVSEVSPVSFPAYPATNISFGPDGTGRSLDLAWKMHRTRMAR